MSGASQYEVSAAARGAHCSRAVLRCRATPRHLRVQQAPRRARFLPEAAIRGDVVHDVIAY
jgi:hypothetical protein